MRIVSIHDAKMNFSRLIDAVGRGEEIIIAKAGRPAARLVPIQATRREREPGALKGKMHVADDFDVTLPKSLFAAFEGR